MSSSDPPAAPDAPPLRSATAVGAWSQRRAEGFALAATAHADSGARAATPGLSRAILREATATARSVSQLDRPARRRWLRTLLDQPRTPHPVQDGRAPRALALLAASVERNLGRAWLAGAPLPRPGYAPDPRLLSVLRRLASVPPGAKHEAGAPGR